MSALPAPSVRLPSTTLSARRSASEAAQHALIAARRFSPGSTPSLALTAAAWSLVMLWQPRILSLVAGAVRRHPILRPTAEDLRQDALTWSHEIALAWDPARGRGWPGYLKLCLGRRLLDHHTRILADLRRHTDRPLATTPQDAEDGTARDRRTHVPEPADPRPSPERALINRALAERIQQAPSAALLKLLTAPGRSIPQRGTLAAASGLLPALRRLLDAAERVNDFETDPVEKIGRIGGGSTMAATGL